MNDVTNLEHSASSSRSKHEGEPSLGLCDRLDRTRDNSQRQLPTDHDYAVPTREYQTDQSSLKSARAAARPVLGKRQKQRQLQKQPHHWSASAIWSKAMDASLSDLGCAVALHTDSSGGYATGLSTRGQAHAQTSGETRAGRHGGVKQASPTLQQVIKDLQAPPLSQTSRLLTEPFRKLGALEPNGRRLAMKTRIITTAFARSPFGTTH